MPCSDLRDTVRDWFDTGEQNLTLLENDDVITLQRIKGGVLFGVLLLNQRPAYALLEKWMHLGEPSLKYFQGALAQDPLTGHLWLLQCAVCDHCTDRLLSHLEALLNQRDTWRSMIPGVTPLPRP